jgi:hypothetical protein
LSSLAALAEHPSRIKNLFLQEVRNESFIYGVVMCKNGFKSMITVDNYIPTKGDNLAFSSTHDREMWVIVLEKAWAKIHGSYERIEGGDT